MPRHLQKKISVQEALLRIGLIAVFAALASCGEQAPIVGGDVRDATELDVEHGRYLAAVGNCVSCHTSQDSLPLGGGVAFAVAGSPFDSPVGKVYSTNISPDVETGIGLWTLNEFSRAMRQGVSRDGRHLYPVFPYTHFGSLTDQDIFSLFAFLQRERPIRFRPPESELPFPLNFRPLLAVWKFFYLRDHSFDHDEWKSESWNRGAYLVLGVGHCGACHSPRNLMLAERSDARLGGGVIFDEVEPGKIRRWSAVNLTPAKAGLQAWSKKDIESYLRTGHSSKAGSFGPMNKVIADGTQSLTPDDAAAIGEFLKSLAPLEEEAHPPPSLEVAKMGENLYREHCAECHKDSGRGGFLKAPPLLGSAIVQSADPSSLINVVLYGAHPDSRLPAPFGAWESMKGFQQKLSDAEVAALASFLRSEWGHQASSVEADEVARQR
jgi:mono/diheme cytochrome c family protein